MSFSHLDDGTPEEAWTTAGAADLPPLDEAHLPGPGDRLLVLAAHPDDESLGAAGLMHTALTRGASVRVLLCTAGEASHPDSPTHTPAQLAALRLEEFAAGLRTIAPSGDGPAWRCLDLPDGALDGLDSELDAVLRDEASGATHLAAPYRSDGHADHDALGAAAARAAAGCGAVLLEYPVWYWHWAEPHGNAAWRDWRLLPLDPAAAQAKERALAAHRSQNAALSPAAGDEALLSPAFLRHFTRPAETFRPTHPGPRGAATAAEDFDAIHTRRPDPWNARTSWYERRKRAATLAALPRERYEAALEAGCSIGTLTGDLAGRCRSLTAIDASSVALDGARKHLAGVPGVSFLRTELPGGWPAAPDSLDLVVVSEVGYFLAAREWSALLDAATGSLVGGGHLVLCHWLGPIEGWELDGETVHATARRRTGWRLLVAHREAEFLLEVLEKPERG